MTDGSSYHAPIESKCRIETDSSSWATTLPMKKSSYSAVFVVLALDDHVLAPPVEGGQERAEVVERHLVGDADPLHEALAPEHRLPEPLVLAGADPLDVGDPQGGVPLRVEVVKRWSRTRSRPIPSTKPLWIGSPG